MVANSGGGVTATASVLLGQGHGLFGAATSVNVGPSYIEGPSSLALADFNRDGHLDVAIAFSLPSEINVVFGDGLGAFTLPTAYSRQTGAPANSVIAADFNHDGVADLAVARAPSTIGVLFGKADGGFGVEVSFPSGPGPTSLRAADLNADGHADLLFVNASLATLADGGSRGWSTGVLLGLADAGFGPESAFEVGNHPVALAVGDFNGDGRIDAATAHLVDSLTTDLTVSVMLGTGTGGLSSAQGFRGGPYALGLAAADFNADGKVDLAVTHKINTPVTNSLTFSTLGLLLGAGTGAFGLPTWWSVGSQPLTPVVGDFNGDGLPDLAVVNYGYEAVFPDGGVNPAPPPAGSLSVLVGVCH